jgi:hypothetical protein
MGSSVAHVVLTNIGCGGAWIISSRTCTGAVTIQPIRETKFPDNIQGVGGATLNYDGIDAIFKTADVMELWGKNRDQPFLVSVIGFRGESGHDFEVKAKHFPLLR